MGNVSSVSLTTPKSSSAEITSVLLSKSSTASFLKKKLRE